MIEYLFPTVEIAEFMFEDLFVELSRVLPEKICFSKKNLKQDKRDENLATAVLTINNFIAENPIYKRKLCDLFGNLEYSVIVRDVLIGYVFYCTDSAFENSEIDVITDKRSVCYSPTFVLDII